MKNCHLGCNVASCPMSYRASPVKILVQFVIPAVISLGLLPNLALAQPELLSASQELLIDKYVTAEMARQHIPGAELGIYRDGQKLLEKGYGSANLEWQIKVTPDTLFQSGSVGKQFLATAIMMLVEQGKIGLDDSISRYFPDAPSSWSAIKVKNLLSHTSGIAEYESKDRAEPGGEFDLRLDFSEEELTRKIEKLPLDFAAGSKWSYSNTNYVLLGIMLHNVTGQYYGDYLRDHIFKPLGMVSTRIISDRDVIPKRAAGYEMNSGKIENQSYVSPTFNSTGDGTIYFNVIDLEKWDRALYETKLLSRTFQEAMWTPFVLNDGTVNFRRYGFGWWVTTVGQHRVIEHGGAWQGFTAVISRYVDDKLTVVVLANLDAAHAHPTQIGRVVAGLVAPQLMPERAATISDDRPALLETLRTFMDDTVAGKDTTKFYAAAAHFKRDSGDAAELRARLPVGWEHLPLALVYRKDRGASGLTSSFRLGFNNDARLVTINTDPQGKILRFDVYSDPDNR